MTLDDLVRLVKGRLPASMLLEAALAGHLRMYTMPGSLQSVEPSARGVGSDSSVHLLVTRP